jgi:60S ribosome subunit biogenesis protein NIP7
MNMYRNPTRRELTILKRTYDKLGCFDFFKDKSILIKEHLKTKERKVYLASDSAGAVALSVTPTHVGLLIGRLGKQFIPSLQGADIFYRVGRKLPFVVVNEIGERLVLYGKNLFGQSITDASPEILASQFLVILNDKRETVAVGRARVPAAQIFNEGSITVYTLLDIGYYLRLQGDG